MHGNGQVNGTKWQINVKKVSLVKKKAGENFQHSSTKANTNTLKTNLLAFSTLCIYSIATDGAKTMSIWLPRRPRPCPPCPCTPPILPVKAHWTLLAEQMIHSHDSSSLSVRSLIFAPAHLKLTEVSIPATSSYLSSLRFLSSF